ncbi:MAG: hypothetical protein B0W54_23200 [Cellvibrio sp. 79]|nr:MAG: hypothetical protein B0W54_23200 [Cellvibrio sp. 79]
MVVLFFLLFSASFAQATPVRYYFEGEIEAKYSPGMNKPQLFRDGEAFKGWVDVDWDNIYKSDDEDSRVYIGDLFYKLFFGDGGTTVSGGGHDMLYIYTKDFGKGLPDAFYDNFPSLKGAKKSPAQNDDTYFKFYGLGGEVNLFYVIDWVNNGYDVSGNFRFTDKFVDVPEPSPWLVLMSGLLFLVIVRFRLEK